MTEPELTPAQDDEVRRLLAGARHDDPVPDDVAERLDRVLAGLVDEPVPEAPVTPLHTRRRHARSMLIAAAAVVVVGIGISQVVDQDTSSEDASPAADRNVSRAEKEVPEAGAPGEGTDSSSGQAAEAAPDPQAVTELLRLRPDRLAQDVRVVQDRSAALDTRAGSLSASRLSANAAAGVICASDAWGKGTFVPVRYDGTPAVLVFRRAEGDTQVAELFLCGDRDPVRTVTLPAP